MSSVVRTARDLGHSHGMAVRRRPQDPSVPIDYVLLAGEAKPGAADAEHDAGYAAGYAAGQDTARAEAASEAGRAPRAWNRRSAPSARRATLLCSPARSARTNSSTR